MSGEGLLHPMQRATRVPFNPIKQRRLSMVRLRHALSPANPATSPLGLQRRGIIIHPSGRPEGLFRTECNCLIGLMDLWGAWDAADPWVENGKDVVWVPKRRLSVPVF
jgi:hypothetical protein